MHQIENYPSNEKGINDLLYKSEYSIFNTRELKIMRGLSARS